MTKLVGAFLSITFDRIDSFDYVDPKTGVAKPINSIIGLMEFGDGRRDWVRIGYPRDPGYRPPHLEKGTLYMMPVLYGNDKKKEGSRLMTKAEVLKLRPTPLYIQYQ